jgi:hypothetical protein
MLPEDQEGRLRCYRNALQNWQPTGYILFKPRVEEWLAHEFPDTSLREIRRRLYEHVENGGKIHELKERRREFAHFEFHYDLRVEFDDRRIYFETILDADDPDDPTITVVNIHDA